MKAKFQRQQRSEKSAYRQLIPMSVAMSEFSTFLDSQLGQQLMHCEREQLNSLMPKLVGYNCLQLSVQKAVILCESESIGHYIKMGYAPNLDDSASDHVWSDYQALPIAHDCIDIAVLHHVLEFASDPAQLLREADRTLTAGGHLLIVGFNPVSAWPLYQRYLCWCMARDSGTGVYKRVFRTLRQGRLGDWLSVLNYDVLVQQRYFFRPPLNSLNWLDRTRFFERMGRGCRSPFGLVYLTLARKRTAAVNPLVLNWRKSFRPQATPAHSRSRRTLSRNNEQHNH